MQLPQKSTAAQCDTEAWPALMPTAVSDQAELVEVRPGRRLAVAQTGADNAEPTVLLVHGAGGHQDQWRYVWSSLAAAGLRVVALDLPGHGVSPCPRSPAAYRGTELVADLRAVFERYAGHRTVIVAHSYGARLTLGMLTQLFREGRADALQGVLLLGAQSPAPSPLRGPITDWPVWALRLARPWLSQQFRALAWGSNAPPWLVQTDAARTDRNALAVIQALFRQHYALDVHGLASVWAPVHLLTGSADRLTPPQGAHALAAALPCGCCDVIDGAGHQLMLERPCVVVKAVSALARL